MLSDQTWLRHLPRTHSAIAYPPANMNALSYFFKVSVADYFRNLPIPDSFTGIFHLGAGDWLRLIPLVGATGAVGYLAYRQICPKQIVNPAIDKANPKVVHNCDIEDITGDKLVYCRCWRSAKFPLCDGSHTKHNQLTGDNVGPLIVKKQK